MSRNTLYNDKVRQQLVGEKAAVGDNNKKLELLLIEYEIISSKVILLGYKGGVLDLEVEISQSQKLIEEGSKLVYEMLQTNVMSSTRRLFKIGVQIANVATVTKAGKKQIQLNKQKRLRWKRNYVIE